PGLQGANYRDDDERQHDHSQRGMGAEDEKVERLRPTRMRELRDDACLEKVIGQVAGEKGRRGHQSGNHAEDVRELALGLDESETGDDEQRTQTVERGVDPREIRHAHDFSARSLSMSWTSCSVWSCPTPS